MKNFLKFMSIALIAVSFTSCNDDDFDDFKDTKVSLGVINIIDEANHFVINLDNGRTLLPEDERSISGFDDGERVGVTYEFEEDDDLNGEGEFVGDISYVKSVLTKDIVELTPENEDLIGDDPIHVCEDDIWMSGRYMNIVVDYLGSGYVSHFVNMTIPYEEEYTEDGRLILEFKHNAYSDLPLYLYRSLVSFDMESLKKAEEESIEFVVRVDTYEGNVFEWEGSYVFGNDDVVVSPLLELPQDTFIK